MRCQEFKSRWVQRDLAGKTEDPELRNHLAGCSSCQDLATNLDGLRLDLRAVQAEVQPDHGFSARVLQRIESTPNDLEVLGWAAWRLLPGALALLVVLLGWGAIFGPEPARLEVLLLQENPSHVAVQLLLSSEEDR